MLGSTPLWRGIATEALKLAPVPTSGSKPVCSRILVAARADNPLISSNTIANNRGPAIKVETNASQALIRRNTMYANSAGSIVFDDGASVVSPELNSFVSGASEGSYVVVLNGGEPVAPYTIELFVSSQCDPMNHGPAEAFLGEGTVETGQDGSSGGSLPGKSLAGIDAEAFTVTATLNSTGETSELSSCAFTTPETFLTKGPAALTTSTSAAFEFSGFDWGHVAGYQCSLDGAVFAECESPQQLTGLGLGAHTFAVRAVDKAGNQGSAASYAWQISPPAAAGQPLVEAPAPEYRESVAVAPAGGKVYVLTPGKGRTELQEGETIPVGSIVDATRGKVTLTSVNRAGEAQAAIFDGGKFLVAKQEGNGLVVLKLRGGNLASCEGKREARPRPPRADRAAPVGQRQGQVPHRRRYGSATVRGTI